MDEQNSSVEQSAPKSNNMMMVGVVGLVLVVLLGGVVYLNRSTIKSLLGMTPPVAVEKTETTENVPAKTDETPVNPATTSAVAAEVVVTYDSTGFTPAKVTVKKGQMVKFMNKTTGPMSVASDPHPTHTIYPEFDQYKTAFKGKAEFDFVFTKVGSWGYHNHAKSSDKGTVVVTE